VAEAAAWLEREGRPSLRPVINGSGVIIHTNLGRAPLSAEAVSAMVAIARGYSNLEVDLARGERGSRYSHCGRLLAELSGADDGLVVNNNASSLLLILAGFARRREVIVSRGQLVEIGGGLRIPDVMRESGVELVEVGSTNRTYVRDYEAAISERTAALMLIHRSNFQVTGFVHDPDVSELAVLAHAKGLLLIDDLGSGTFLDTDRYGLAHEPKVQERVAAGADLVCFSGDKLLGGPQAGYIVGRKPLVDALKKVPMLRALRVDKVTLAGIEATLRHYVRGDAIERIPVWRSIAADVDRLEQRARAWKDALELDEATACVVRSNSTVGGGSLPGLTLPTRALALYLAAPDALAERLRAGDPPVVGRIEDGQFLIDPRTVMPHEDDALLAALRTALLGGGR
jgi:L-seryl-tRNA(Ser) seleniumtransferase